MTQADLSIQELVTIAASAGVFKLLGEGRRRRVVVDYVPPREPIIIPREPDEEGPLNVMPPEAVEIAYTLEDAMFGGVVYVALTVAGRVVIHPFVWESYDKLARTAIPTK